jgi:alpha-1,2-mannosyltransferase
MPLRGVLLAHPFGRWAIVRWAVTLAAVGMCLPVRPAGHGSVFPIFRHAGTNWLDGADLYPETQQGPGYPLFRYSPAAAASFIPFAMLPERAGDLAWLAVNVAALLGGLALALRALPARRLTPGQTAAVFALLLPLAVGHLGDGQCNGLVIGLVLVGYTAAAGRRFTLTAVALAAATLLKLYPLAPALLLVALYPRRLGPRFALALAVGLGLPFVLADPGYVARQYALWARYFLAEDRSGWPAEFTNVDLQLVVRQWIGPMTTPEYRVLEALGGLLFFALTLAALRRLESTDRAALLALGLGCVWMTALGPATESPTFLLLAPITALTVVQAWARRPTDWVARVLATAAFVLLLSVQLTLWKQPLFDAYRTLGPQPVAGLLVSAALVWDAWVGAVARPAPAPPRRVPAGWGAAALPVPGESS